MGNNYYWKVCDEGNELCYDQKFFSVGRDNQWSNKLSKVQVKKIENCFKKTMNMYEYKINS